MSQAYRIEREAMPPGSEVQTFRVIVALPRGRWGTVQAGLDKAAADALLAHVNANEATKRTNTITGGYRR